MVINIKKTPQAIGKLLLNNIEIVQVQKFTYIEIVQVQKFTHIEIVQVQKFSYMGSPVNVESLLEFVLS